MPRASHRAVAASRHAVRGLSLLELLIAMLLGLLLSAGMVSVFLASKQNYYYEEQLARLQEIRAKAPLAEMFGYVTPCACCSASSAWRAFLEARWIGER